MEALAKAKLWLEQVKDKELYDQLSSMLENNNEDEIADAFFQDLSFGTAGLRGIIGPGTNRMNIYTVGRATQGLADYIRTHCTDTKPSVALARDSRHKGEEFTKLAASILAANGIKAYVFPRVEPTPALSFAVRTLGCFAGICMTASHNPAAYNGYKVYGADGCQITSYAAQAISHAIDNTDPFTQVHIMDFDQAVSSGKIAWIDDTVLDRYIDAVVSCGFVRQAEKRTNHSDPAHTQELSVVYTPLCGTGLECMNRVFQAIGMEEVHLVDGQSEPDGSFPGCEYPNPEERSALEKGIATCKERSADLLLATDPDADRVGIAVKHGDDYILPTGNEVGLLLFDFICKQHLDAGTMPEKPLVVSTIVSTAMLDTIAESYGAEVRRTLTGFKYIGDIITALEQDGDQERFIFGFEESYGYLSGTHVRDKDAINAGLLICQMAQYYKQQGKDLIEALHSLYEHFGFYANRTVNIAFPGASGAESMKCLMQELRSNRIDTLAGQDIIAQLDYTQGLHGLPTADVVELNTSGGGKVIFRPSGTEPKVKIYLFAQADSSEAVQEQLDNLETASRALLGK